MENEAIISFEDFGFQYTAQAEPTLYDINLQIRKGEKVLIAGPSGCGKSTLAHCINGLVPNSYPGKATGKLTICGKNALELGLFGLSKIVGTVLQDSDGQFIGLTVAEDIAFALENDCIPTEEMHREVVRIAELVDVKRVLKHAPHEISGGQKQRVGLGGVMVGQVDVLLFDEPLANLDPATGKQAIVLIDEIQKRTGCAVIIIEHRVEDVLYCPVDRVIVMGDGRIQYDGDPDTLLCSELLQRKGIREPLYVTALKYAGVELTADMRPSYLPELKLSESQKQQVRTWFEAQPEAAAEVTRAVKAVTTKPVIIKLSPNVTDIVSIAKACEEAGADGISLINTLLGMRIDLRTRKPVIANKMGGFSGSAIFPVAVRMVYQVAHAVSIPVVGMGGVSSAEDVIEMMLAGATAVEVGAANLVDPFVCRNIVRDLPEVMKKYRIENLTDIIGGVK